MFKFSKYVGEELSEMPIDVGNMLLKLRTNLTSGHLDTYIYQNDAGDLFYVNGVLQYTNMMMESYKDDRDDYHLTLVIPILSKEILMKFLKTEITQGELFEPDGDCYIMKLDAPEYDYEWSGKIETNVSMHPVKDRKEVTRKIEAELKTFPFKAVKVCKIKSLDDLVNPAGQFNHDSTYRTEFDENMIDWRIMNDEEKELVKNYINA
jgi:hypothetical protein